MAHGWKWVRFEETFKEVEMQTWFLSGRQRYWVVAVPQGSSATKGRQRAWREMKERQTCRIQGGGGGSRVLGRTRRGVVESGDQEEEEIANSAKRRVSVEASKVDGATC
jgi:hypothetical protein